MHINRVAHLTCSSLSTTPYSTGSIRRELSWALMRVHQSPELERHMEVRRCTWPGGCSGQERRQAQHAQHGPPVSLLRRQLSACLLPPAGSAASCGLAPQSVIAGAYDAARICCQTDCTGSALPAQRNGLAEWQAHAGGGCEEGRCARSFGGDPHSHLPEFSIHGMACMLRERSWYSAAGVKSVSPCLRCKVVKG